MNPEKLTSPARIELTYYEDGEIGVCVKDLPSRMGDLLMLSELRQFSTSYHDDRADSYFVSLAQCWTHQVKNGALATDWDTQGESHAG